MKHIILTILVCLDVAAFVTLYQRTTQSVTQMILDGLSQISVSTVSDLYGLSLDTGVHQVTSEVIK